MVKYLTSVTETYRVNSEADATAMIEEAKKAPSFILAKYSCIHKERKAKGEVIDEWYRVILVKDFNDEKEPVDEITVTYE